MLAVRNLIWYLKDLKDRNKSSGSISLVMCKFAFFLKRANEICAKNLTEYECIYLENILRVCL